MLQSPHHTVLIYSEPSVRALNRHAIEALAKIVGAHWPILISDTPQGGDALIQRWLMAREYDLVTVYYAQDNPRFNAGFKQTQKISDSSEDALTSMAQTATLGFLTDIVVTTPAVLEKRKNSTGFIYRAALAEGKDVYVRAS